MAVDHNQLRTMASEPVYPIDWSHPSPSWAVSPGVSVQLSHSRNLVATLQPSAGEATTLPMRPLRVSAVHTASVIHTTRARRTVCAVHCTHDPRNMRCAQKALHTSCVVTGKHILVCRGSAGSDADTPAGDDLITPVIRDTTPRQHMLLQWRLL